MLCGEAIVMTIKNSELREFMGQKSFHRAGDFSWPTYQKFTSPTIRSRAEMKGTQLSVQL